MSHLSGKYAIVGVGETEYSRGSGRSTRALGVEAVRKAMLEVAGIGTSAVVGSATMASGSVLGVTDATLVLAGVVNNGGTISVNPSTSPTTLAIVGSVTLLGGGKLAMATQNGDVSRIVAGGGFATLIGEGISLDELAIGFTLGLLRLPAALVIVLIALQAFIAAQLGLRLGSRLSERLREGAERLAGAALTGLGIVPFIYVVSGFPRFANYPFTPVQAYLGIAVFVAVLWLFCRTHHDLGANWSWSRQIKCYFDWEHAVFGSPVVYAPGKSHLTSDLFWAPLQIFF